MLNLDAKAVAKALPRRQLIEALDSAFSGHVDVPQRAHHEIPVSGGAPATLLLMPAWSSRNIGVKVVTVFPDNGKLGIPTVSGSYLLLNVATGEPIAMLDSTELTLHRTAAASALASSYLSRPDASSLLMVGTGNLAPHLIRAHAEVRTLTNVTIWGRRADGAAEIANALDDANFEVGVVEDLQTAVQAADIISCATLTSEPLIAGAWLRPGQHLDLVGAFKPDMAEADTQAIALADVYVDTRAGALAEAGEIVRSIAAGVFTAADIMGSLRELAVGSVKGRTDSDSITLFKSVGTALEDLSAAELAIENQSRQ